MKRGARIPSLLRELADAFDELLTEAPAKPRKSSTQKPTTEADQQAIDAVRRRLRKSGVAA